MSTQQEKSNGQFDEVTVEALSLMLKKYDDYGSSWTYLRPHSLADQIFIKLKRIWNIQETGEQKVADTIDSDIFGILNYAAMALSRLRGDVGQNSTITKEEFEGFMKKSFTSARDLFQAKNHDYGAAWRDLSVSTMTDLMIQKIMRLRSIKRNKGETKVSEGAAANYLDIMNYAIFCLIQIEEGTNPMD